MRLDVVVRRHARLRWSALKQPKVGGDKIVSQFAANQIRRNHKAGTSNFMRLRPLAAFLRSIHGAQYPNNLISHVSFNPTETQSYVVIHDAITNSETLSQTFVSLFVIAIPGYYILPC
jgi:hypothetical protein